MLRSILSAVCRTVAWAANKCTALMMIPVHALLAHLFPAAYEPLPTVYDNDGAVDDLLPNDRAFVPFRSAEEVRQKREIEVNRILTWAADAACNSARPPLPNVRPELLPWLASLSDGQLDALVSDGKDAAHGHLYFSMPIPGVPTISSRGSRPAVEDPDPTFNAAEFGPAAVF